MKALSPSQIAIACSKCAHFNGIQNDTCEAGVSYEPFRGSLPCLKQFDKGLHVCTSRRWITAEEAQAEHAEAEKAIARMNLALPLVSLFKAITRDGGASSFSEPCPACQGTLRVQIARSNLHARVCCTTPGCIQWIE